MNILVLNGSPRKEGNTAAMVEAFAAGAREAGHQVDIVPVCQKRSPGAWPVNTATPKATESVSSRMICSRSIPSWNRPR